MFNVPFFQVAMMLHQCGKLFDNYDPRYDKGRDKELLGY